MLRLHTAVINVKAVASEIAFGLCLDYSTLAGDSVELGLIFSLSVADVKNVGYPSIRSVCHISSEQINTIGYILHQFKIL